MKHVIKLGLARAMLLAGAALVGVTTSASAQIHSAIFDKIEPSLRDRMFMRLNYIHANVKTTSEAAYDVTGPVVARGDIARYLGTGSGYTSMFNNGFSATVPTFFYDLVDSSLNAAMDADAARLNCPTLKLGLGTPCGIKAKSSSTLGTPALSLGYYLDAERYWTVEAFLLAAPLRASVYGDGDNGLNGKRIIDLKMLPPTGVVGRYFGPASNRIRPFVGLGVSYAVFYDTKTTADFNNYQGGKTSVSVENALGVGPFLGVQGQIDENWHVSFNFGKLSYRTTATLVTRDTRIASGSPVLLDYGPQVEIANNQTIEALVLGPRSVIVTGSPEGYVAGQSIGGVTGLMCDLAKAKYGNNNCSHGTYVRKQKTVLDSTLFMLSVGRRF